jgi:hypoxanthine phosphoribosyltransferase
MPVRDLIQSPPAVPADAPTVTCQGERFRRYLHADALAARVAELGAELDAAYDGLRPILVGVLNGAFMFVADLMRAMSIDCEIDFMKLSSYGAAKISSGQVRELKRIDAKIKGRHVLIVEDIVDTGLSMEHIIERLTPLQPASLRVVTLLHKPEAQQVEVPLDYVGFRIPSLFVLGYGLDYGQLGRHLADLYILDEEE